MRVIHTAMVFASDKQSKFAACICECRWVDRARGHWNGRIISYTGAEFTRPGFHSSEEQVQADCDALSRAESERLSIPARYEHFPVANHYRHGHLQAR